jgi:hypothetical protein
MDSAIIAVMRVRRVTLLIVIYLALDFATPMMPGAVQFVDGSLDLDAGCCGQRTKHPAPAVTALPRRLSTFVPPREPILPAGRVISASPPAPVFFRAPVEPRSTPASSPDDD